MDLIKLGWNEKFQEEFNSIKKDGYIPARVIREDKGRYILMYEGGECSGTISGKLRHNANSICDFPAVGDWVAVKLINEDKECIIYLTLNRKSSFTRKAPVSGGRKVKDVMGRKITLGGSTEEQVVAANVDYIFIVVALDYNFNLRRLERFLLLAYNSGATPVIILNKIDLCDEVEERILQVEEIAIGVDIHSISAVNNVGVDKLRQYLSNNNTIGLFGTSGVGKSTLINALSECNKVQTGEVRESDSKGRHTTTWRELVIIPTGGVIIDTPGMRELQIWSGENELDEMFEDIIELEGMCKFRDCSHIKEPGCAITSALKNGTLDKERYENYLVMRMEVGYLNERLSEKEREERKAMIKSKRYMQGQIKRQQRLYK